MTAKTVPREPTQAMQDAMRSQIDKWLRFDGNIDAVWRVGYDAAPDAAPPADVAGLCARLERRAEQLESDPIPLRGHAEMLREAAARIAAQQNWHLAALYATCPGVTANDDAKAWQAQQIAAILQLIHRAEAAESRCAELYDALSGMVGLCALLLCNDLPPNVREGLESNHRVVEAKRVLAAIDAAKAKP